MPSFLKNKNPSVSVSCFYGVLLPSPYPESLNRMDFPAASQVPIEKYSWTDEGGQKPGVFWASLSILSVCWGFKICGSPIFLGDPNKPPILLFLLKKCTKFKFGKFGMNLVWICFECVHFECLLVLQNALKISGNFDDILFESNRDPVESPVTP